MDWQYFGTIETAQGNADAMLCIDADRPLEFMFSWDGAGITPGAVLARGDWQGQYLRLFPMCVCRISENGSIFWIRTRSTEEEKWFQSYRAVLEKSGTGFRGEWTGPDGNQGTIALDRLPKANDKLAATRCESWDEFKSWARNVRSVNGARWFRGHGCNSFSLTTKLFRHGRTRLERYCANELKEFTAHAEAVLKMRLDLSNSHDYSVVLGLAQHHGLPTPMLDWTESPYIAAFFAFSDALEASNQASRDSTHVRIYALSDRLIASSSPPVVVIPLAHRYVASIAITLLHNPRLYAQQGRFLVTNIADIESFIHFVENTVGEKHLFAADVPVSCAAEALQDLAFMGLTAATMFPGLDGIGQMIRHKMAFRQPPTADTTEPGQIQESAKK